MRAGTNLDCNIAAPCAPWAIDFEQFKDRPVIGIANSWSELNNCNMNLRDVAAAVRRGILAAGALPLEFPTISLGEEFMKPTAMLYRNLMAMDVEETLRANPLDGVVLLCNCDKTGPAQLMGAASANLPAIQVNGGPRSSGVWRGIEVGSGTDLWKYWDEYRMGKISKQDWHDLEQCMSCGAGACNVMGTASTMSAIAEGAGHDVAGLFYLRRQRPRPIDRGGRKRKTYCRFGRGKPAPEGHHDHGSV